MEQSLLACHPTAGDFSYFLAFQVFQKLWTRVNNTGLTVNLPPVTTLKKNNADWYVLMAKIAKAWEKAEEKEKEEEEGEEEGEVEEAATVSHKTMSQSGPFYIKNN